MTGQSIAHYKVTAKLGQGGMGAVYREAERAIGPGPANRLAPARE
jgi:hypothetical protein